MRLAQAGRAWRPSSSASTSAPRLASSSGSPNGSEPSVSTGAPNVITLAIPRLRRKAAVW